MGEDWGKGFLVKFHQCLSALYLVAYIDTDSGNLACKLGGDAVLHLHRFHDDNGIARSDFLTYTDEHLLDGAWQRSLDNGSFSSRGDFCCFLGCRLCCGLRCRSRFGS